MLILLISALINSCHANYYSNETALKPIVGIEVNHNFEIGASSSNLDKCFLSMRFKREVFVRVLLAFTNCATTYRIVAAQNSLQYAAHLQASFLTAFVAPTTRTVDTTRASRQMVLLGQPFPQQRQN